MACWLAEVVLRLTAPKRAIYRRMYRAVDLVIVFSANQRSILSKELGIPPHRIAIVPFGIDADEFCGLAVEETGSVVAVGRDAGRDWPTFFKAVAGTGWNVKVACRQHLLVGLQMPTEVDLLGYVDRVRYGNLVAGATVVVIATQDLAYPTGQSVLLEAMASGKACVVTETEAMSDYAFNGVNCLTVPQGDEYALRSAVSRLLGDSDLRRLIGNGAREFVMSTCNVRAMWRSVGRLMVDLA